MAQGNETSLSNTKAYKLYSRKNYLLAQQAGKTVDETEGAWTTSWHSDLENKHTTTTKNTFTIQVHYFRYLICFRYSPTNRELTGRVESQTTVVPVGETWK